MDFHESVGVKCAGLKFRVVANNPGKIVDFHESVGVIGKQMENI